MASKEKMGIREWLKMVENNPESNAAIHADDMREQLYNAGIIAKRDQKNLYTVEQIFAAFRLYLMEIVRQLDGIGTAHGKGSKDIAGKITELILRIYYAIAHGMPFPIADMRARSKSVDDMRIAIDNRATAIECKVGQGTLASGATAKEAVSNFEKLLAQNPIFVWFFNLDLTAIEAMIRAGQARELYEHITGAEYIAMHTTELMECLEGYNGNIGTWLVTASGKNKANGNTGIKFQQMKDSERKKVYLRKCQFENGIDILTMFDERTLN